MIGDKEVGEWLAHDTRVPLISATGSTRMGKASWNRSGRTFGTISCWNSAATMQSLLSEHADLNMAVRGAIFRRSGNSWSTLHNNTQAYIHESIYEKIKGKLIEAYKQLKIGNPLEEKNQLVR